MSSDARRPVLLLIAAGVLLAVTAAGFLVVRSRRLPAPGSAAYEAMTRTFYRGLAALQVGLLDDATAAFTRATEIVPGEPAAWANLGLAHLRLGQVDGASRAVDRAAQ